MLAIVWAMKYFRTYLFWRTFKILSDHRPLQWLFSLKDANSKLLRWRLKLGEFDYEVVYQKGKANTHVDALSRVEINTKEAFSLNEFMNNFNEKLSKLEEDDASMYNNAPKETQEIDEDRQNHLNGKPEKNRLKQTPPTKKYLTDMTYHKAAKAITLKPIQQTKKVPIKPFTLTRKPNIRNTNIRKPINVYKNQVLLKFVNYNPSIPVIEHTFPNKQFSRPDRTR
ncbi:hypothetical protein JTB14_031935 [Gonioctena quinquepunctata]|nr:hypothetical protein JTB14_031935 [Gonioctena quinquepunctata]